MAVTFRAATCHSVRSSGITAYLKLNVATIVCAQAIATHKRPRNTNFPDRTAEIVRVALPRRSDLKEGPSDMPSFAPGVRERLARSPVQRAPRRAAGLIGHGSDRQRIDTRRRERLRFSRFCWALLTESPRAGLSRSRLSVLTPRGNIDGRSPPSPSSYAGERPEAIQQAPRVDARLVALALLTAGRELHPDLWVLETKTMDRHLALMRLPQQLSAFVLSAFGGAGAGTGRGRPLTALVSYSVARRTGEIGIRMALGADSSRVVRVLGAGGLQLVVIGGALGLTLAVVATRCWVGCCCSRSTHSTR